MGLAASFSFIVTRPFVNVAFAIEETTVNRILIIVVGLILAPMSSAQEAKEGLFDNNFISLRLARNFPMQRSQKYLGPGYFHPQLFYTHNIDNEFLMGVGLGFKSLRRQPTGDPETDAEEGQELAVLAFSHNSQYVLRLYHPHYLLFGAHMFYLFPSRKAFVPLKRSLEFESEIAAGVSVTFLHRFNHLWLGSLGVQWWRGTKTTRMQAIEAYGELIYEIP